MYKKSILSLLLLTTLFSSSIEVKQVEASSINTDTVVRQVNQYREKQNLKSLKVNSVLSKAAQAKAEALAQCMCFSHKLPDGRLPWDFIKAERYSYWMAGENLAMDFTNTSKMTKAWMESPGHRANILNSQFTETGIGITKVKIDNWERIYVVQMFALPY